MTEARGFFSGILFLILFLSSANLYSQTSDSSETPAAPTLPEVDEPPAPTPPPPPPFSETQIKRNIDRVSYLKDSEVIKLGLKYIEKIQAKMDLSEREDLRTAIVSVIVTDTTQVTTVSREVQDLAAQCLGHLKMTNRSSAELIPLLGGESKGLVETAAIEYARTTKSVPNTEIMDALKAKSLNNTIREIALATADHDTIHYLVTVAQAEHIYDPLYGLDSLEAAEQAIKNYIDYFNVAATPTNLVATLTTYNSIQLDWVDNSTNEEQFEIDVSINGAPFTELIRVPGNTIHYSDQNLAPEKTYTYRVRALNLSHQEIASNEASVTTPPKPNADAPPIEIPPLPSSPTASLNLSELTKRIRILIEGKPHKDSIAALILYVKTASASAAVEAGRVLSAQFSREAFDSSPAATSLGFKAITETNLRATNEFVDFILPESLRREYGNTLRRSSNTLQDRFVKDETPK